MKDNFKVILRYAIAIALAIIIVRLVFWSVKVIMPIVVAGAILGVVYYAVKNKVWKRKE
jgi:Flp pilus assembly protein TadB